MKVDVPPGAWLLVPPEVASEEWRARGVPLLLVPLEPAEAVSAAPPLEPAEEALARLVARGQSPRIIARELSVPLRTVYRRLANLRERFGASSTAELGTELARRGL